MPDILKVQYQQTGASSNVDALGMRQMQARAFERRHSQYILLKAPPACGKSRAMMYLALDKMHNQGIKKVIVAVPEMSIGGSFRNTKLTESGFFADWAVEDHNNLCLPGVETGKTEAFRRFMKHPTERILICTHATLRFAFESLKPEDFNGCMVGIDEFHHVSASEESRLGGLIDDLMKRSSAHILAMTGSYFRGDAVPILLAEDEAMFEKVTYTYYEQLNGYKHLKSLGIGYHFYQGPYVDALPDVLDTKKKTIIHIPNVNSREAISDKHSTVDAILDVIGTVIKQDARTGIITVRAKDGRTLKIANLVDDNPAIRPLVVEYLRDIKRADEMDIIIALGMAKEGFDWPFCEHVLTIGYRSSMTEIVQIIGRATRDSAGKLHAQFTNLIAQPDAEDDDVKVSVNNMLKAITLSLLMEQVLAPAINFRPRSLHQDGQPIPPNTILIEDKTKPVSQKVLNILNGDSNEIIAQLVQTPSVAASAMGGGVEPAVINQIELPKVIEARYPDLTEDEVEQVQQGVLTQMVINSARTDQAQPTHQGAIFNESDLPPGAKIYEPTPTASAANGDRIDVNQEAKDDPSGSKPGNRQFIQMGEQFINIEHLNIDLIAGVNPFHGAYEILSKSITPRMLKTIQDAVAGERITMSEEEAVILWPRINEFVVKHGREPSDSSNDPIEARYAEALSFMRNRKRQAMSSTAATSSS